ncbi:MAG TPA: histidine kinase, partial [Acidimicrobiia bacterium]|nr:histidine kinase [Acidimicrobiia bacterium]
AQSVADLSHPEPSLAVGVTHAGDTLGALQIAKPRAHPVTQADRQLLDDVAAGAGLLLRNLKLNAELADRARALEASRRRLIAAQDTARHRLERDLHDGAQQQVVALKVKLGIARTLAERDGVEEIAARLASLADQTDRAITQMRRIARGIYPPLLEAEGLATALAAVERTFDRPVTVTAEGIGRYDKQIEETAYFGALTAINDALTNGATTVAVTVAEAGERLVVAVDSDATRPLGASGLVDRIEALGGAIDVVPTAPGRLTAAIPTNVEVASG